MAGMTITDKNLKYAEARALGHSPESAADLVGYESHNAVEKKLERDQELQEYYEHCRHRYSSLVYDLAVLTTQKITEKLHQTGKDGPSETFLLDLLKHTGNSVCPPANQQNTQVNTPIQINNHIESKPIENLEQRVNLLSSAVERIKK